MTNINDGIHDPRSLYEDLDIPKQRQDEPGLDAELKPQADHGQTSWPSNGRLKGRKALITGGDSGIGRATAIAYAKEGADVVIHYLPSEQADADETLKEIKKTDQTGVAIAGDLADESFCIELVEQTVEKLGGIDIIVNNAGRQLSIPDITNLSRQQIETTFAVNILAMFSIVRAALPHLPAGASIINTTSIQATKPSPDLLDYAATKAAIVNFTKGLSAQLIDKGIRVNAVAPGPIWTPLQPSYGQQMEKLVNFGKHNPYGRAGQPAELAGAYVYLASNEASYVTGATIPVTGGELFN